MLQHRLTTLWSPGLEDPARFSGQAPALTWIRKRRKVEIGP
jgi:hypothetical protein